MTNVFKIDQKIQNQSQAFGTSATNNQNKTDGFINGNQIQQSIDFQTARIHCTQTQPIESDKGDKDSLEQIKNQNKNLGLNTFQSNANKMSQESQKELQSLDELIFEQEKKLYREFVKSYKKPNLMSVTQRKEHQQLIKAKQEFKNKSKPNNEYNKPDKTTGQPTQGRKKSQKCLTNNIPYFLRKYFRSQLKSQLQKSKKLWVDRVKTEFKVSEQFAKQHWWDVMDRQIWNLIMKIDKDMNKIKNDVTFTLDHLDKLWRLPATIISFEVWRQILKQNRVLPFYKNYLKQRAIPQQQKMAYKSAFKHIQSYYQSCFYSDFKEVPSSFTQDQHERNKNLVINKLCADLKKQFNVQFDQKQTPYSIQDLNELFDKILQKERVLQNNKYITNKLLTDKLYEILKSYPPSKNKPIRGLILIVIQVLQSTQKSTQKSNVIIFKDNRKDTIIFLKECLVWIRQKYPDQLNNQEIKDRIYKLEKQNQKEKKQMKSLMDKFQKRIMQARTALLQLKQQQKKRQQQQKQNKKYIKQQKQQIKQPKQVKPTKRQKNLTKQKKQTQQKHQKKSRYQTNQAEQKKLIESTEQKNSKNLRKQKQYEQQEWQSNLSDLQSSWLRYQSKQAGQDQNKHSDQPSTQLQMQQQHSQIVQSEKKLYIPYYGKPELQWNQIDSQTQIIEQNMTINQQMQSSMDLQTGQNTIGSQSQIIRPNMTINQQIKCPMDLQTTQNTQQQSKVQCYDCQQLQFPCLCSGTKKTKF